MTEDLINSILDDLNDLMQDELFCWDLTDTLERLILRELQMKPSDYFRDRIEKERHILRTLDYLNEVRREQKNGE